MPDAAQRPPALAPIVVMGVAGSGKSTLAREFARHHGARFLEADDYHGTANVAKMASGQPLDDGDRWPWLDRVAAAMDAEARHGALVVCACSALRRRYRDRLRAQLAIPARFVCLDAPREVIRQRMSQRPGHYMPVSLLDSQIATLELPQADEDALLLDAERSLAELQQRMAAFVAHDAEPA
jgi:gluconokinase